MPISVLSLVGTPPTITQDGTTGSDAVVDVNYGAEGQSLLQVNVFASPVGGGTPVLVGSSPSFLLAGGSAGLLEVPVNVDGLDPSTDYVFFAVNAQNNLTSNSSGPVDIVPCFAETTLIATARGELPVERLRAGDLVLTMEGGAALKPIRWVGRSRVNLERHPDRAAVAPILIRAGALADGVPARDLRVSPEHAMFLDGCLVPARLLVNGASIVQETWRPDVTYWHVELPAHGLLVSDGAVSESYFDYGNRKHFDNGAIATLVKDFGSERVNGRYAEAACRPLLLDGPALEALRARLALRAGREAEQALTA